jgi:hypothetical protein
MRQGGGRDILLAFVSVTHSAEVSSGVFEGGKMNAKITKFKEVSRREIG